jgi:hypothetical protein
MAFLIGSRAKVDVATILDLYSRFIVGCALRARRQRSGSDVAGSHKAVKRRRPDPGLLHRSTHCNFSLKSCWDDVGLTARGGTHSFSQVVRRRDAVNIDHGSGRPSRAGCRAGRPHATPASRNRSAHGWFRDNGGMPPTNLKPLSGHYLSFAEREEIGLLHAQKRRVACVRLLGASSVRPRIFRANCDGMRRLAVADSSIARQRLSGTQSGRQAPEVAKLAANAELRQYVQELLAGTLTVGHGATVGSDVHCERSSSRSTSGSALGDLVEPRTDSRTADARLPMKRRCGSHTKPFTKRCTSKADVRSVGNWRRAYEQSVRSVPRARTSRGEARRL